jgi:predicted dehydrogenase
VPADVPDHVVATAEYPGGVVATIEMSTVTMRGRGITAQFHGTDGTLEAEGRAIEIRDDERDEWRAEPDFVAAIRGEKPVELTDFETGLRYMEFVDAVHESSQTGLRVDLRGGG